MLLAETRQGIVRACRELSAAGLVVGTAGNVSAREGDLVAVTPSGVDYADMSAEQVGVHRLDGAPVDAPLKPTSELPLHLAVYAATGAGAVVHTHSPAATAVSTLTEELPPIHYYVAMFGGTVRVAPYATYGTDELARNVAGALDCRTACLLGSHGAVTTGADLKTAHERAVYLEWLCDVYLRAASAGTPRLLPPGEIEAVARKLASYGQLLRARHGGRSCTRWRRCCRYSARAGAVACAIGPRRWCRCCRGACLRSHPAHQAGGGLIQLFGAAAGEGSSWLKRLIRAAPSARGDLAGRGSQVGVGCRESWHRIPACPARITSRFSGRYWSTGTPASLVQNRAQCSASSAGVMNERHSLRAASTRSSTVLPSADFRIGRFNAAPEPDPQRSVTNQRPPNSWNSTITLEGAKVDNPERRGDMNPSIPRNRWRRVQPGRNITASMASTVWLASLEFVSCRFRNDGNANGRSGSG